MASRDVIALMKSVVQGDSSELLTTALQVAAHEARKGHPHVAKQLRDLVDRARERDAGAPLLASAAPLVLPRGDLAQLLTATYPTTRLANMVLEKDLRERLDRIVLEQRQSQKLLARSLPPRRKLLLSGSPGTGKTMTAAVIAGELRMPLFTIRLEGVITRFLGETAQKLRVVFEAMTKTRGVYFFDEFDAFGTKRGAGNDVGEIRRVLNSFLVLLESDASQSVIVAATNHPELLDRALFRRFDDVMEYRLPETADAECILRSRLAAFGTPDIDWPFVLADLADFSQADLVAAALEAAKSAVLEDRENVITADLLRGLKERRKSNR